MKKLILVEGTWGSGKTTTARFIKEYLDHKNVNSTLFTEGDLDHPVDPDHVACFSFLEYQHLLESYREHAKLLKQMTYVSDDNYFIPYAKLEFEHGEIITDALFNHLKSFDVYDGNLTLEKHCEVVVNHWADFAKRQLVKEEVVILECCFLQNPVIALLARYHAEKGQIIQHVMRMSDAIRGLRPVVVYFQQESIENTLKRAINERSTEWINGVTKYCLGQGYGERRDVEGGSGLVQFLKERDSIEQEILNHADLDVERFVTLNNDMDDIQSKIKSVLDANFLSQANI